MKHGLLFSPHCSLEDMQLMASGTESFSPVHVINVEQLEKIRIPTAMDCLTRSAKATAHQMVWKSTHGAAYLHVGRAGIAQRRSTRRTSRNDKKVMWRRLEDPKRERTQVVTDFLKAWLPHTPRRLQGSIMWINSQSLRYCLNQKLCHRYSRSSQICEHFQQPFCS
uniref:Uncharacterized protein n=1 Tax=Arundo donax TaxID=35708 RepID=A0A0A9FWH1_ARUDO